MNKLYDTSTRDKPPTGLIDRFADRVIGSEELYGWMPKCGPSGKPDSQWKGSSQEQIEQFYDKVLVCTNVLFRYPNSATLHDL